MTILVTGANGSTGQAVLRALRRSGATVRALVHRKEQSPLMQELGAAEVVVGDMRDTRSLAQAMDGAGAIYHICPAVQPDEAAIGHHMIEAARAAGVAHFVFHSVLHPQIDALPHHREKLRVEAELIQSDVPFTILQPAPYMQNTLGTWERIRGQGIYSTPYGISARMSLVHLDDVAEAAVRVLTEEGHTYATYELSGPAVLTAAVMAEILSHALGRPIVAEEMNLDSWEQRMRAHGMSEYAVDTLAVMFRYYSQHGFTGNPTVLKWLLKRPPTDFATFVARIAPVQ